MSGRTWQLQEAKSRFSELVEHALTEGPQVVTRRGVEVVVVTSVEDYQEKSADSEGPLEFFRRKPYFDDDLVLERDRSPSREVNL